MGGANLDITRGIKKVDGQKILQNFAFNVKLNVTSVEREENLGTSMKSEKRTYLTLVMKIPSIAVH